MGGLRRALVLACVCAVACVAAGATAGASQGATAPAKAASKWSVGDCYADAQVDFDEVDLASKVACTTTHDVQIIGGARLPAALAGAQLSELTSPTSSVRPSLVTFANTTCSPATHADALYPKLAKSLQSLFRAKHVTEWTPPVPGQFGWVLPDATSFAAGTKDVLCIFHPSAESGTSSAPTADVRRVARRDPMPGARLCFNFNATNTGTDFVSCAQPHDQESLIWISQDVTGHPAAVADWKDADYAPFDATCSAFAKVLIGADRKDLVARAELSPNSSESQSRRFFDCVTYPKSKTARFPAGFIAAGARNAKVSFVKTS